MCGFSLKCASKDSWQCKYEPILWKTRIKTYVGAASVFVILKLYFGNFHLLRQKVHEWVNNRWKRYFEVGDDCNVTLNLLVWDFLDLCWFGIFFLWNFCCNCLRNSDYQFTGVHPGENWVRKRILHKNRRP